MRPVEWNEMRKTVRSGDQNISYIVDKDTGVRFAILHSAHIKVHLLTLQLDQGCIGTIGAAFLVFQMHLMVW